MQVKAGFAVALALAVGPKLAAAGVPLEPGPLISAAVMQAVAGLATVHFMQHRGIHLLVQVRKVVIESPGEARAAALVAMAGSPIPGPEALPTLNASLYYFDVELRAEDGGWKIVRATWSPATADDY